MMKGYAALLRAKGLLLRTTGLTTAAENREGFHTESLVVVWHINVQASYHTIAFKITKNMF